MWAYFGEIRVRVCTLATQHMEQIGYKNMLEDNSEVSVDGSKIQDNKRYITYISMTNNFNILL